jgi:hypothetical protein
MTEAAEPSTARKTARPAAKPPRPGPVGERVAALRTRAVSDAEGAREEAWAWIEELGRTARERRESAHAELQELFLCGQPADDVRGQTDGILVSWTMHPLADRLIGALTDSWMPWLGKKFDRERGEGVNTLTESARWPAKIVWPLYSTRDSPLGRSAFDFKTYVEAGRLDPEVQVLVIDYEKVPSNPLLLIRQIRDELVRVVPGANLGKMLVDVPGRSELFPALFFALRSELA